MRGAHHQDNLLCMSSREINHSQMFLVCWGPLENPSRSPACQQQEHKERKKGGECTDIQMAWFSEAELLGGGKTRRRFLSTGEPLTSCRQPDISGHTQRLFLQPEKFNPTQINPTLSRGPNGAGAHVFWIHFSFISFSLELKLFTGLFCNSFKRITSCLRRYGFQLLDNCHKADAEFDDSRLTCRTHVRVLGFGKNICIHKLCTGVG